MEGAEHGVPVRHTISRRAVLAGGGAMGLAVFVPWSRAAVAAPIAVPVAGELPRFLDDGELATLRALVDRFVPGQPEDPSPGAVDAGCAEAIDALLAAFDVDPPLIYAGAPFSDRAGSDTNHFAEFLPLDAYEERAWRLKILGSRGEAALERNGPVAGWQATYRAGLAALDEATEGVGFATLPGPARDVLLRTSQDPNVTALVDVAFPHTLEFLFGAPEYGGNRDLVGWEFTDFDGDVQPRGWTAAQVEHPDTPTVTDLAQLPDALEDLLGSLPGSVGAQQLAALAAMGTTETTQGLLATGGGLADIRAQVGRALELRRRRSAVAPSADVQAAARAVARQVRGAAAVGEVAADGT